MEVHDARCRTKSENLVGTGNQKMKISMLIRNNKQAKKERATILSNKSVFFGWYYRPASF